MDDQLLAALKALADASRLTIIGLLAKQPQSVDALAAALGLAASTVSQHLSKLSQAGLVEMREEQYYNMYSLKPGVLEGLGTRIVNVDADPALTTQTDEAAYDRAVIAKYVQPYGIAYFPKGLQKQRAILRWCGATHFAPSTRYREFEVEDILQSKIVDVTDTNHLRRYMISEKVLARSSNGGWYWRADTPEVQRPGFMFEQLATARHLLSPNGVARQLNNGLALAAKNRRRISFSSYELDTRMRELGVRDIAAMRARMQLLELLAVSSDGLTWSVTDPKRVRELRNAEVVKRFLTGGMITALPADPPDRRTVLRWFADMLPAHKPTPDRDLDFCWRRYFADVPTLKKLLLEAGLFQQVDDTHVAKYGLNNK